MMSVAVIATPTIAQTPTMSRRDVRPLEFKIDELVFKIEPMTTETEDMVEVTLAADVLFDFDKADIKEVAAASLKEVGDLIRANGSGEIKIVGYTDAKGDDAYNQRLSEQRATSVKTWLATREAIPSARMVTSGGGENSPVAPNTKPDGTDDPEGRALNRRVTITIPKR
jgi:outer membrane protein OmpA-like peptidoglycan-associated protein